MSVVRWRPFEDMLTLREAMDRLFEDASIQMPVYVGPLAKAPPRD